MLVQALQCRRVGMGVGDKCLNTHAATTFTDTTSGGCHPNYDPYTTDSKSHKFSSVAADNTVWGRWRDSAIPHSATWRNTLQQFGRLVSGRFGSNAAVQAKRPGYRGL